MNTLSVSSYSVREHLGPVKFDFVDPAGTPITIDMPFPKLLTLSEFPARARDAFGVDAIETVGFQFAGLDDPEIDSFGRALTSSGVRLLNVAVDVGDLLETDADKLAADVALLKKWIERFSAIGSEFVRVNPGSPFAVNHGDGTPPSSLVDALAELGEFANQQGTRLLVENHGGPSSDPQWIGQLLEQTGTDSVGLLLDLGNFDALMQPMMAIFFGSPDGQPVDPASVFADLDLSSLYTDIRSLADRAELVHVKSHEVSDEGVSGPIDLPLALSILKEHGYAGALTVEYEGTGGDPWAKSASVLDITRSVFGGGR